VYFSLLTLALTAMLFAVAYRWTDLTGGESGLGGIVRPPLLGVDLGSDRVYYWVVAAIGFLVCAGLWRFHGSPVGSVLVAIRENEQRARFIGYSTNRYKLLGFVVSATVVGIAGVLSVFNHRFASADPLSVAFSGELIAMVVIGGMRSFLGPALGALFYICSASSVHLDAAMAALVRAPLCRVHRVLARPASWALPGGSSPPSQRSWQTMPPGRAAPRRAAAAFSSGTRGWDDPRGRGIARASGLKAVAGSTSGPRPQPSLR
jgi:ABC-type branched-subunit amino acid transport system permease subunit